MGYEPSIYVLRCMFGFLLTMEISKLIIPYGVDCTDIKISIGDIEAPSSNNVVANGHQTNH